MLIFNKEILFSKYLFYTVFFYGQCIIKIEVWVKTDMANIIYLIIIKNHNCQHWQHPPPPPYGIVNTIAIPSLSANKNLAKCVDCYYLLAAPKSVSIVAYIYHIQCGKYIW